MAKDISIRVTEWGYSPIEVGYGIDNSKIFRVEGIGLKGRQLADRTISGLFSAQLSELSLKSGKSTYEIHFTFALECTKQSVHGTGRTTDYVNTWSDEKLAAMQEAHPFSYSSSGAFIPEPVVIHGVTVGRAHSSIRFIPTGSPESASVNQKFSLLDTVEGVEGHWVTRIPSGTSDAADRVIRSIMFATVDEMMNASSLHAMKCVFAKRERSEAYDEVAEASRKLREAQDRLKAASLALIELEDASGISVL